MEDNLSKLIENGFEFLEKAISQFHKEPKFSVINFCIATELFLKARLMKEHWSLVVSTNPNISAFKSGNFKSINFTEILPKIENITGEKFDQEITSFFNGLANHRNKMVHFYHDFSSKKKSKELIEQIAIGQSSGWHHLSNLLEKWKFIFKPYNERINEINSKMKQHEIYIKTVYEKLLSEIKN